MFSNKIIFKSGVSSDFFYSQILPCLLSRLFSLPFTHWKWMGFEAFVAASARAQLHVLMYGEEMYCINL